MWFTNTFFLKMKTSLHNIRRKTLVKRNLFVNIRVPNLFTVSHHLS